MIEPTGLNPPSGLKPPRSFACSQWNPSLFTRTAYNRWQLTLHIPASRLTRAELRSPRRRVVKPLTHGRTDARHQWKARVKRTVMDERPVFVCILFWVTYIYI